MSEPRAPELPFAHDIRPVAAEIALTRLDEVQKWEQVFQEEVGENQPLPEEARRILTEKRSYKREIEIIVRWLEGSTDDDGENLRDKLARFIQDSPFSVSEVLATMMALDHELFKYADERDMRFILLYALEEEMSGDSLILREEYMRQELGLPSILSPIQYQEHSATLERKKGFQAKLLARVPPPAGTERR